ncbi:SRPBCC family protein [Marinomonas dokdonensis]|uniref:SRPBCC family protein n=1 Tax=Marinomonas dokdonensis TaxID=328224 RepID=UPI0040559943
MSKPHPQALYQLRKVTRFLAVAILLLVVVGFFLPSQYRVERSIEVSASAEEVLEVMLQGQQLSNWMYIENGQIEPQDGTLAAEQSAVISYLNTAEQGRLTLLEVMPGLVTFEVLPKPGVALVENQFYMQESGGVTSLRWVIEGELNAGLLGPYIALLANNIAGKNFETSLARLKQLVEG